MLFLTGGTGALGRSIKNVAIQGGISCFAPPRQVLDITDFSECQHVMVKISSEDTVIHCAAMTNWEMCHTNPEQCFQVNAIGTWNIARATRKQGALLIYISSDAVFNARNRDRGFTEVEIPNDPVSVYGISKLAGENLAKEAGCRLLIVRLGWFFGVNPQEDKKFIGSILRQGSQGEKVLAVNDRIGTMTYIPHVAKKLCEYALHQQEGVRHLVNYGNVNRCMVAQEVFKLWGFTGTVTAVRSENFPTSVKRPGFSALASIYNDAQMTSWQEALTEYHYQYSIIET